MRILNLISFFIFIITSASSQAIIIGHNSYLSWGGKFTTFSVYVDHWDEDSSLKNPCYKQPGCKIASFPGVNNVPVDINAPNVLSAENYETIGELGKAYKAKYPLSTAHNFQIDGRSPEYKCFRLATFQNDWHDATFLPDNICIRDHKYPVSCSLLGDTNLYHGYVSDKTINGNTAQTQLTLSCSKAATAKIYATGFEANIVSLRSDDSLQTELNVNDQDASEGINIEVNSANSLATFTLSSTLRTHGTVAPGAFNGAGTLIISAY
ncbi:hypothetical protein K5Y32_24405 [Pantoea sp. DY-15]|uniref:MrpH family fimbial adhesin n=1 Tax=unclassified Pantoea TaxID=2630326 RepID=UPI001C96D722|nr:MULTISPECIES: hypothetical protein [unclassified Pantoea]MBY4841055.1 hypothetical protein [Pantoea sp. DY-5]MBY4891077.1 hypothetical protein [Pantoea sp. DY-15]